MVTSITKGVTQKLQKKLSQDNILKTYAAVTVNSVPRCRRDLTSNPEEQNIFPPLKLCDVTSSNTWVLIVFIFVEFLSSYPLSARLSLKSGWKNYIQSQVKKCRILALCFFPKCSIGAECLTRGYIVHIDRCTTDMTIHWKALEEHFLIQPFSRGRKFFFFCP
jgi:hypothetical protein